MRSSQDTGGVSGMHKQNFAMQPRDWPTTSEEAWRFNENLHAKGRPSTATNGQNKRVPVLTSDPCATLSQPRCIHGFLTNVEHL